MTNQGNHGLKDEVYCPTCRRRLYSPKGPIMFVPCPGCPHISNLYISPKKGSAEAQLRRNLYLHITQEHAFNTREVSKLTDKGMKKAVYVDQGRD